MCLGGGPLHISALPPCSLAPARLLWVSDLGETPSLFHRGENNMNWGFLCARSLTCFLPSPYNRPGREGPPTEQDAEAQRGQGAWSRVNCGLSPSCVRL